MLMFNTVAIKIIWIIKLQTICKVEIDSNCDIYIVLLCYYLSICQVKSLVFNDRAKTNFSSERAEFYACSE